MTASLTFSCNTGFLYPALPFLERIRAAARDGFEAVEFHDEGQSADRSELLEVLAATRLPVIGLNVAMGPTAGSAALPGERARFELEFASAAELADAVDAAAIHVLAGKTDAPDARATFERNLRHALAATDRTLVIEPLCSAKMPDYWLNSLDVALDVIGTIGDDRLKLLFDCFHIETEHGNVRARFERHVARIGHVQIASVPARAEPGGPDDRIDYAALLPAMRDAGFAGPFGAEYVPSEGAGLVWRDALRGRA